MLPPWHRRDRNSECAPPQSSALRTWPGDSNSLSLSLLICQVGPVYWRESCVGLFPPPAPTPGSGSRQGRIQVKFSGFRQPSLGSLCLSTSSIRLQAPLLRGAVSTERQPRFLGDRRDPHPPQGPSGSSSKHTPGHGPRLRQDPSLSHSFHRRPDPSHTPTWARASQTPHAACIPAHVPPNPDSPGPQRLKGGPSDTTNAPSAWEAPPQSDWRGRLPFLDRQGARSSPPWWALVTVPARGTPSPRGQPPPHLPPKATHRDSGA